MCYLPNRWILSLPCVSPRTQLSSHPMCCVEGKRLTIITKLYFLTESIKNTGPPTTLCHTTSQGWFCTLDRQRSNPRPPEIEGRLIYTYPENGRSQVLRLLLMQLISGEAPHLGLPVSHPSCNTFPITPFLDHPSWTTLPGPSFL